MSQVLKTVSGTVGTSATEVTLSESGATAKGGLLANTHASQVIYVGGAGQGDVSSSTGYPVAAGKAIPIDGTVTDGVGFYIIGSGASTSYVFLPSATD